MSESSAVMAVLFLGFVAGILSGMFGIGGGLVIVPALVILFGYPLKMATGTSLFALLWPVGLLGVGAYWKEGQIDPVKGGLIALGLFCGAYLGAQITLSVSAATMKRGYAVFLLVVGMYFLLTVKSEPAAKAKPTGSIPSTSPADLDADALIPPPPTSDQVH